MPLYDVGGLAFWEHFPMCAIATFWDAVIVLSIYLVLSVSYGDYSWVKNLNWRRFLPVLVIGSLIALFIEERALYDGRWAYNELMPIVPFSHAGLSPVLQMFVLPSLTFYLSSKLSKK